MGHAKLTDVVVLADHQKFIGLSPGRAHAEMLKAYVAGERVGGLPVADAIAADVKLALSRGSHVTAAGLLNVLRMHAPATVE